MATRWQTIRPTSTLSATILFAGLIVSSIFPSVRRSNFARVPTALTGSPVDDSSNRWLVDRALRYDSASHLVESLNGQRWEHLPRESVWFANVLLGSSQSADRREGRAVVRAVLALQEQRPTATFAGLWPVVVESPLTDTSSPDMNWAEFVTTGLLNIVDAHPELPARLVATIDSATLRANALMRRRTLWPGFQDIHALQTGAMIRIAQHHPDAATQAAARDRLTVLHRLIVSEQSWDEYNSPAYSPVALDALLRARTAAALLGGSWSRPLEESIQVLCDHLRDRYVPSLGELAGPHSRAYSPSLADWSRRELVAMIAESPGGCGPSALRAPRRVLVDTFIPARDPRGAVDPVYLGGLLPVVGSTLIGESLAFGTVSVGGFWEQHRPVMLYVGSGVLRGFMRARLLLNGSDLSAAQWLAAQQPGMAIGTIVLATDGGGTHPDVKVQLDTVVVHDLRLRLEFGGDLQPDDIRLSAVLDAPVLIRLGSHRVTVVVPWARFSGRRARWMFARQGSGSSLDYVLAAEDLDAPTRQLESFAMVLAVAVDDARPTAPAVATADAADVIASKWGKVALRVPGTPGSLTALHRAVASLSRRQSGP